MQIYVLRNGEQAGPYSLTEIQAQLANGDLSLEDLAWHEGLADWIVLSAVDGVGVPATSGSGGRGKMAALVGLAVLVAGIGVMLFREGNVDTSMSAAPQPEEAEEPVILAASFDASSVSTKASFEFKKIEGFLENQCLDCHDADMKKGGLDLDSLSKNLDDPAAMAKWVRLHDRVENGEMPPKNKKQPAAADKAEFLAELGASLTGAHAKAKGTVLRRLNRIEYGNTMNDLFGTHLDLSSMLPEDGRSHEFDNVGEALSVSSVQLQTLLDAVDKVMDTAIVNSIAKPEIKVIKAGYLDGKDGENFLDKHWGKAPDGAVVFFRRVGYPSGQLRGSRVPAAGFYKIRVTGYAYQSENPITFSIGATTYQRGAEKPTFGYYSMPPGKPSTVEIETFIDQHYMIQLEPYGLSVNNNEFKKIGALKFKGPGLAINHVEIEGPIVKEFPSRGHRFVFDGINRKEVMPRNPNDRKKRYYRPNFVVETTDASGDATKVLQRVATKAFRRPVTTEKLAPYVKLFEAETANGSTFEEALRTSVAAVFCSPDFLYFQEKPGRLDDHALATRLSYFLTRTLPDEQLLAVAEAGKLTGDVASLQQETDRILKHAKSEQFVKDFTDAWLDLRSIDFTNPDRKLYPEFDEFLKFSMLAETRKFFRQLLKEDLSIANFIDSDFAMLNSRLAEHYDVPNVSNPDIQKVSLPKDSLRGGIMAHASILKVSANGTTTSPVLRGVWALERIFGITPPPPPPSVPGVEPDIRGAETIRELLDKHRSMTSCQGCHLLIDPPGFALESFNPIGGYRERFRSIGKGEKVDKEVNGRRVSYRTGPPVDASGQLTDGRQFKDFNEFKQLLLHSKDQVAKCVTKKLLTFATGREMGFSDRPEIDHIVKQLGENGDGLRTLIHLIVQSEIFKTK